MKSSLRNESRRLIILLATMCLAACTDNTKPRTELQTPGVAASEASPNVAMSGNGHGVILFRSDRGGIFASSYSVEGGLESAVRIGDGNDAPVEDSGDVFRPSVVMDPAGNAVAVWRYRNVIYSSARPFGGGWSVPTILDRGDLVGDGPPVVAVDAAGNAIAAWAGRLGRTHEGVEIGQIWISVRLAGGAWSAKRSVGVGISDRNPRLAVHRNGAGWLAFVSRLSGGQDVPTVMPFSLPDGPVGTPIPLTDDPVEIRGDVALTVDAAGNALVVWTDHDERIIYAQHVHPLTGPVGAPRQLVANRPFPEVLRPWLVAAGSDRGDAIIAWKNDRRIEAVLYQDGVWSDEDGAWSGVFQVDPRFTSAEPDEDPDAHAAQIALAMTPAGDATLAYGRGRFFAAPKFMAARRFIRAEFDHGIRGSGWQQITEVERLDSDSQRDDEFVLHPVVAMEARDSALLVWQAPANGGTAFVDVFAWAPPLAAFAAMPLGDRTVMFDASSSRGRTFGPQTGPTLRQYEWDFDGDGAIDRVERGSAEATHTYPAGGTWNPRLRVTDVELLTAETSRQIDTGGDVTTDVVFEDTEFFDADWEATAFVDGGGAAVHSAQRITSDGNPGAYRQMSFDLGGETQSLRVFYTNRNAVYAPATQGAIAALEFREDRRLFAATNDGTVGATFAFRQGERYFIESGTFPLPLQWQSAATAAQPAYVWNAGPLCPNPGPGVRCPDLTETGEPITFGYMRVGHSEPLRTDVHGIDNWRVTLHRGPP